MYGEGNPQTTILPNIVTEDNRCGPKWCIKKVWFTFVNQTLILITLIKLTGTPELNNFQQNNYTNDFYQRQKHFMFSTYPLRTLMQAVLACTMLIYYRLYEQNTQGWTCRINYSINLVHYLFNPFNKQKLCIRIYKQTSLCSLLNLMFILNSTSTDPYVT